MLPSSGRVLVGDTGWIRGLESSTHAEIQTWVLAGMTEPLGHELYREAREQWHMNPRSALILAIAAAEVGFKQFVSAIAPAAGWLAVNSPSPPLVDMLEKYLPTLPGTNKIGGKMLAPPPAILTTLKKGVGLRNKLSHQGSANLTTDILDEVLTAVRDVLWLLDYYYGYDWAWAYISDETRQSLAPKSSGLSHTNA